MGQSQIILKNIENESYYWGHLAYQFTGPTARVTPPVRFHLTQTHVLYCIEIKNCFGLC